MNGVFLHAAIKPCARYYVSGGRNVGGRQMRGGRRPHKKVSPVPQTVVLQKGVSLRTFVCT